MDKQRVALAMIVGNGVTEENWFRLMRSVENEVDGLFVAWTGDGPPPDLLTCAAIEEIVVESFPWDDDFAAARNFSFSLVPRDEYDWILWLDDDDELILEGATLQEMIESLRPDTQAVWFRYAYSWNTAAERQRVGNWRERMFRADNVPEWKYDVHEVAAIRPGSITTRRSIPWVKHWFVSTPESERAKRERNRRIVAKAYGREPENPRYILMMANEMMAAAKDARDNDRPDDERQAQAGAAKLYEMFLQKRSNDDDAYTANNRLATILRESNHPDEAINQDLQGIKIRPTWIDSWLGIAETYLTVGDYAIARDFLDIAIGFCKPPVTQQADVPEMYDHGPYFMRGQARMLIGDDLEGAIEDFEQALSVQPDDETTKMLLAQAREKLAMQAETGQADPATLARIERRGSRPEKSVSFVTNPLFEPWGPKSIAAAGSGGAEHCVVEIAQRFARDGWRVAVFGTPGDERGLDDVGVEWWSYKEYDPNEPFTVTISSRVPQIFDGLVNSQQKILWMHDVNVQETRNSIYGDSMAKPDIIVGLTEWHRLHLRRLYGLPERRTAVIPNGIDPELFAPNGAPRQRRKYVWGSSPDRGVDVALGSWPELRRDLPDAELHIFYGWAGIDKIIAQAPGSPNSDALKKFKRQIQELVEQVGGEEGGIFWRDRQPRWELAKAYSTADAWLYPTTFCETFCITALETQAAGVIPLVTDLAALRETVPNPRLRVRGMPNNENFRRDFIRRVKALDAQDERARDALREEGRAFASQFTWDAAYERWRALIGL